MKECFVLVLLLFLCNSAYSQIKDVYIPYRNGDKWGFMDTEHNVIIKPEYQKSLFYKAGLFFVGLKKRRGVLNKNNEFILECKYNSVHPYGQMLLAVDNNNESILFDRNGDKILKADQKLHRLANDTLLIVEVSNKKIGILYINQENFGEKKWLIDTIYSELTYQGNKKFQGMLGDTIYNYEIKGTEIIKLEKHRKKVEVKVEKEEQDEPVFEDLSFDSDYVPKKRKAQKHKELLTGRLKGIPAFSNNLVAEFKLKEEDGTWKVIRQDTLHKKYKRVRMINKSMEYKSKRDSAIWEDKKIRSMNLAVVRDSSGLEGVIDVFGEVLPCEFEEIYAAILPYYYFETQTKRRKYRPYYICAKNNKWGIVNEFGKVEVDFKYESIKTHLPFFTFDMRKGIVCIKDGKYGVINLKDEILVPFEMDRIEAGQYIKFLRLEKDGKHGLFDGKYFCKPVYPAKLDKMQVFNGYPVIVLSDEKWRLLGYGDFEGRKFIKEN